MDVTAKRGKGFLEVMNVFARTWVITLAVVLGGCAYSSGGGEVGDTGYAQIMASTSLPAPTVSDVVGSPHASVIGPYDVLIVDVFAVEELTGREIVVDGAGRISVPLAGTIDAAGKVPNELATLIANRLRANYMRDPLVSVNVKEATSQVYTVDGQVERPGVYPALGQTTLMRAIASAEGLGDFAKQDDVVVLRTVGGQEYAGVYNIAAIRRGNYPDPQIFANDVVIVGDSPSLRRMRDMIAILPAVVAPVIYILSGAR